MRWTCGRNRTCVAEVVHVRQKVFSVCGCVRVLQATQRKVRVLGGGWVAGKKAGKWKEYGMGIVKCRRV